MSAQQVWRFRDRVTGEWLDRVFFEKPDKRGMVAAEDFEIIHMRLLGPDDLDPVTVERCADLAKSYDDRTDILKISGLGISTAIRKLTGGGNG